jgi:hypothetical protein
MTELIFIPAGSRRVRELYGDAPELGRVALENGLSDLKRELAAATRTHSAGRIGAGQGRVSEFTLILPFAGGGAERVRGLLQLLGGNFQGADRVGIVHDMRFVFLDNDTKLLFATAYDDEWNPYIDDFVTKRFLVPWICSLQFEGFPGDWQPAGKRLVRQPPDRGGKLVRRESQSDRGGDPTPRAHRVLQWTSSWTRSAASATSGTVRGRCISSSRDCPGQLATVYRVGRAS